jgi:hypothetical protein
MAIDWTMRDKPIVAIGLLSADDLSRLGPTFHLAWPIEDSPCFNGLLEAIDEADRRMWQDRDRRNEEA